MDIYEQCKKVLEENIAANIDEVIGLNDYLADNPELSGEEYGSARAIAELLRKNGFAAELPFAGLDTAFKAVYGDNNHRYKIALMAEYDALPEIGHACGHCVSASVSVLAALALKDLQDVLDADIHVIGTPNEENDGAKCLMVNDGIFNEYDFAMMIHMYDRNLLTCKALALDSYIYTFHGKSAHAAASPWEGVNALNAAQLMIHGIDCLRQHVTPDVRLHYIYRNGGAAPNIVPEEASIEVYARALERNYLNELDKKLQNIAEGAALMTGATWDRVPTSNSYDNVKSLNCVIDALNDAYADAGLPLFKGEVPNFGSTDAGNVSFVCPTVHSLLKIAPEGTPIHTRAFQAAVKSDEAHQAIAKGALVTGLEISRIFGYEDRIKQMKAEFALQ